MITVMFACNGERGQATEAIEEVAIDSECIRLSGPVLTYREYDDYLRVGRCKFTHHGMQTWVGNWCWDAAQFEEENAKRLIRYLFERGWKAEEWPTEGPWAELFVGGEEAAEEDPPCTP